MITLTEDQLLELCKLEPEALDPRTQEMYILVRKRVYQRLRRLVNDDVRASAELVDKIMAEDDANDPYLASYQSFTREPKE